MSPGDTYDVVIVGGGVVGCAIARGSRSPPRGSALVEAAHDVGEGASKGNTGIATCGADCTPGTLEAELVTRSAPGWEALCASLDTPWERIGTLCVALTKKDEAGLDHLVAQARANGCEAERVSGEPARELEPLISDRARAAVHFPDDGIVDSLRLTIGYAELAAQNGVRFLLGRPVTGFECEGDALTAVRTPRGDAAGARSWSTRPACEADAVSRWPAARTFRCWPRQGQYWLLDRELGAPLRKVVGGVPDEHTRGIYCVPTTNQSLLLGPTADDREDRPTAPSTGRRAGARARGGTAARAVGAARVRDQDVCGQPPRLRPGLPARASTAAGEPDPRRRHPLDRRVRLAGDRRAWCTGCSRRLGAPGARRAPATR